MMKLTTLAALAAAGHAAALPNVILMLVDDVGWGDIDLGVNNHTSPASTPNLRAMASSSNAIAFKRFYSGGAVCSPTRSTMLSGRTPTRECIINVEQNAFPLVLNGSTTAAVAKAAGYLSGFFGKWHLGSLSSNTSATDCYKPAKAGDCSTGYVSEAGGLCCDGRDAHVAVSTPLEVGFDFALATPQVSPSSNANCGCVFTVPGAGQNCNIGHYGLPGGHDSVGDFVECDQYFTNFDPSGNASATLSAYPTVSPVDDAEFLVDGLETFITAALGQGKPFFAQLSFHGCHVPYISPPAYRAQYAAAGYDLNHQDYYGCLSNIDAQVGRIRSMLAGLGVAENTWLSLASDNGPELNYGGHDCSAFDNPGSAAGLVGRKRALTEGGIRIPGVIEFPPLIKANRVEEGYFPASTMDYLPTLMDLLGLSYTTNTLGWPVDGTSLLPLLKGQVNNRTQPIGWLSDFEWQLSPNGNATADCNNRTAQSPPSLPNGFATPFNQLQLAWTEANMKLFACQASSDKSWRFSLYDVVADPAEQTDLWPQLGNTVGDAMFQRYQAWQQDVKQSVTTEDNCVIGSRSL